MRVIGQFVARRESVMPDPGVDENWIIANGQQHMKDYLYFTVTSPPQHEGRRVLVFHGDPDGQLVPGSRKALQEFGDKSDMVYCCYPFQMRRRLRDERIQGLQGGFIYGKIQLVGGVIIVTIYEKD